MEPSGSGAFRALSRKSPEVFACSGNGSGYSDGQEGYDRASGMSTGRYKMNFLQVRAQNGASTRIAPASLDHVFVLGHQPARDLLRIVPIPAGPASFCYER